MKNSVALLLFIFGIASIQAQKNKFNLLIGTYTNKCDSKGIYVYDLILIQEISTSKTQPKT